MNIWLNYGKHKKDDVFFLPDSLIIEPEALHFRSLLIGSYVNVCAFERKNDSCGKVLNVFLFYILLLAHFT